VNRGAHHPAGQAIETASSKIRATLITSLPLLAAQLAQDNIAPKLLGEQRQAVHYNSRAQHEEVKQTLATHRTESKLVYAVYIAAQHSRRFEAMALRFSL
jgi:acetyl-CoA carboxylase alpha subunit